MSHSPSSYIDGVPVKISEKYKPPPKISLPQKIVQCLAQCASESSSAATPFQFQLEHDTQIYLSSWKNQRQQERFARKERLRQRQIERQRQLDEHQKRMLTAVSYPSAEDLSSDDDKDDLAVVEEDEEEEVTPQSSSAGATAKVSPEQDTPQPRARFDTILLPTIMPGPPKPHSSWSFVTNLADGSAKTDNASQYSTSAPQQPAAVGVINWSDFETDTSNPFDNVELKSINDLDILAQVLKQNYITASTESSEEPLKSETFPSQNENILNSNGDSAVGVHQNHSIASHPNPDHPAFSGVYASNYSYQTQHHHQQPISPQQPLSAIQHHQVYFNYQNQTMMSPADNNYTAASNCNQKYAANYGAYGPQGGQQQQQKQPPPLAPPSSSTATPIKANSVPDILRQLNGGPDAGHYALK